MTPDGIHTAATPSISRRVVTGFGQAMRSYSDYVLPQSDEDLAQVLEYAASSGKSIALRGTGNSYGDASLNHRELVVGVVGREGVHVELAEALAEGDQLVGRERLVARHQHQMLVQGRAQGGAGGGIRGAQVDVRKQRPHGFGEPLDRHATHGGPSAPRPVGVADAARGEVRCEIAHPGVSASRPERRQGLRHITASRCSAESSGQASRAAVAPGKVQSPCG